MLFAALIATMLREPFGDGPELCLYGLFMRAVVLRDGPFMRFGCNVVDAVNQVSRLLKEIMRSAFLKGPRAERWVLARRLSGRRIEPFMIFNVAQVLGDRRMIA